MFSFNLTIILHNMDYCTYNLLTTTFKRNSGNYCLPFHQEPYPLHLVMRGLEWLAVQVAPEVVQIIAESVVPADGFVPPLLFGVLVQSSQPKRKDNQYSLTCE